ncbi:Ste24 endopeptidase [Malassezia equina]|uniref:Ste24 endopeptidase n=1 Tax=Malassezia equina TaxID=1381935 RepID=A0AAF0ECS3_9BASI|nr:Ste24 endopeptidase [Malassezia equina]
MTWLMLLARMVKISVLNSMIFAPLYALSVFVVRWCGDSFVASAELGYVLTRFVESVIYPKLVQPFFYELTPLPEGQLRDRIMALTSQLHFPLKNVYVADEHQLTCHANGYFHDRVVPGGSKRIILSNMFLKQFSVPEIEVLLAQDIASWFYSHPIKLELAAVFHHLLLLCIFTLFYNNTALFRAFGFGGTNAVVRVPYLPLTVGFGFVCMLFEPTTTLWTFAFGVLSRHSVFQADRFAATLSRLGLTPTESDTEEETHAALLKRALIKLQIHNLPTMHVDPLYSASSFSPTLPERLSAIDRVLQKSQ